MNLIHELHEYCMLTFFENLHMFVKHVSATSLCFSEKQVYTQEILAIVIQQLMEVTPLPTLLMRTVIQSLSLYPWLIGFVMNVLQRLILKQVKTRNV